MPDGNQDDLEKRVASSSSIGTGLPAKRRSIDNLVDNPHEHKKIRDKVIQVGKYLANKENWKAVSKYLTNKQRLKAMAILGGTIAGVAILKDKLPAVTEYIRDFLPFLSKEGVSLTVDTLTNTLMAPLGYLLSNYAHGKELSKKEFLGHVAFAGAWGVARHYVYDGLSNFDEITPMDVSLKTSLYTLYYAAYGGLYATFSEYWHKVCEGASKLKAIKGVGKNFKEKLNSLAKDSGIQLNLALNLLNMFNPWVESRPTFAGGLLIQYNMDIIKHADEKREVGFIGYLKSIFQDETSEVGGSTYVEQVPLKQKIEGYGEVAFGDYLFLHPLIMAGLIGGSTSYQTLQSGDLNSAITATCLSLLCIPASLIFPKIGQEFRKEGYDKIEGRFVPKGPKESEYAGYYKNEAGIYVPHRSREEISKDMRKGIIHWTKEPVITYIQRHCPPNENPEDFIFNTIAMKTIP